MDNILFLLAKCSIDFLILLISKYENGTIDHTMFCSCAELKIKFLESHLWEIKTSGLITSGKLVIIKSYQIKNSCYLNSNTHAV